MKTFTIENETNNITHHATAQDAEAVTNAERFRNEAGLAKLAAGWPPARLVEVWNSLPGVTPVRKFKDRATAVSRIWKAIQSLGEQPKTIVRDTAESVLVAPVAPQTPDVAPEEVPAKTAATRAKKAPVAATKKTTREGSKTEVILALVKQSGGTTLKAIMDATNWQAHSVRGFISGTLGRKMGLKVLSTRGENGERSYSIPS